MLKAVFKYYLSLFAFLFVSGAVLPAVVQAQGGLTLPDVADSEFEAFIGSIMSWGPVTYLVMAVVGVAVVGLLLRAFFNSVGR